MRLRRVLSAVSFQRSAFETKTRDLRELDDPTTRRKTALGLYRSDRLKIFCHARAEFNDIGSRLFRRLRCEKVALRAAGSPRSLRKSRCQLSAVSRQLSDQHSVPRCAIQLNSLALKNVIE